MKKLFTFFVLGAVVCMQPLFADNPEAKITVHVVDDQGHSLIKFPVGMGVISGWKPGEGFGTDLTESWTNITDANGMTTATHKCYNPKIGVWVQGINGYYSSRITYNYTNAIAGKLQPWNPTVEFVVKPILNPIPMYARNLGVMGSNFKLPAKNTPIGFDLEAADFVAPYGKGTSSDFIFTLSDIASTNATQKPTESALTITFPNKGDGIQPVISSEINQGSVFSLPRYAPEGGYQATLVQKYSQVWVHGRLQENQNYFYRVRTVLDGSGNVKSALYGKIAGPIQFRSNGRLQFTYYLNPNNNDRNMEFDPTKNLFQNLSDLQQVQAP